MAPADVILCQWTTDERLILPRDFVKWVERIGLKTLLERRELG